MTEDEEIIYGIADAAIRFAIEKLPSVEIPFFLTEWYHGNYSEDFKRFALEEYGDD